MASIRFGDLDFALHERESVLEGLERQGESIPNSCRSGICQSCLLQAAPGTPPETSQAGLKPTLAQQGYFMACKCYPEQDLAVSLPSAAGLSVQARVLAKIPLGDDVLGLRLVPDEDFACRPGQYINLVNGDVVRSYSVANLPDVDGFLELHIKRLPGGRMSNWVHDTLAAGDGVELRGPAGNCFYLPGDSRDFPIVLAGTGTGLAPLEGIARDALQQGHEGPVILVHGAVNRAGLYHVEELSQLVADHARMTYLASVRDDPDPVSADLPALVDAVLADLDLAATHVFLCGAPDLVNKLKTRVFLKGVGSSHIFSDPFITAPAPVAA